MAISSFPTIKNVVKYGEDTMRTFTAYSTIKAGQVVCVKAGTTGNLGVAPSAGAATEYIVGVAVTDATAGQTVAVATEGSVCQVANAETTPAIAYGTWVVTTTDYAGAVVAAALTGGPLQLNLVVGLVVSDIAANGTGYILVRPHLVTTGTASP